MIEIRDLKKSFATPAGDLAVLKGIDCAIQDGEMIAVVGASGAGKSTFLHIVGALDLPTSGEVLYDGQNAFSLGEKALASFRNRTVGFVFQFHHLLPDFSALENVMMPGLINGQSTFEETVSKAEALMSKLDVLKRKTHRPGELSGGEQQRVAVARALLLNPKIVLADEPTGNLDAKTGEELFSLLRSLNETLGTTFVIVTHNISLAQRCDRVVEMKDGRINL